MDLSFSSCTQAPWPSSWPNLLQFGNVLLVLGSQNWSQHSSCALESVNRGENHFPRPAVFAFLLTESSTQLSFTTQDDHSLWTCPPGLSGPFLQSYLLFGPCPVCSCAWNCSVRAQDFVSFQFSSLSRPLKVAALPSSLSTVLLSFTAPADLLGNEIFLCLFLPYHPWSSTRSQWVVFVKRSNLLSG